MSVEARLPSTTGFFLWTHVFIDVTHFLTRRAVDRIWQKLLEAMKLDDSYEFI